MMNAALEFVIVLLIVTPCLGSDNCGNGYYCPSGFCCGGGRSCCTVTWWTWVLGAVILVGIISCIGCLCHRRRKNRAFSVMTNQQVVAAPATNMAFVHAPTTNMAYAHPPAFGMPGIATIATSSTGTPVPYTKEAQFPAALTYEPETSAAPYSPGPSSLPPSYTSLAGPSEPGIVHDEAKLVKNE